MPRRRPHLLGAAVGALLLLPATAPAATLTPLKPCYVTSTDEVSKEVRREPVDFGGGGFAPGGLVDLAFDGKLQRTVQADPAGNLPAQALDAPYRRKGQRAFKLTATDRANPANTVDALSNVTAFDVSIQPSTAAPSDRVRFRGRGFTGPGAVYGHYLNRGRVRKTVKLARHPGAPCGTFSVRRRQIPVRKPRLGQWLLQIDQQRKYHRAPERGAIRVIIRVESVFTPPR
ncbi:MAG: hypothetical protein QOC68_4103 [Solirubrobacteraceae bacterium]|jgi:hypothetical protein|nr:hypothetical protein [Solirubrobacteraceae bacterium]